MALDAIDYTKFSDECLRLARRQRNQQDARILLRMATAWLLVAEIIYLAQGKGSADGNG